MINPVTTPHAETRRQQQGIPSFVVTLLETCGSTVRGRGADLLIFDKAAIRRLKKHLGGDRNLRIVEPWLKVFAVIGDDGCLISVAHATRRHHRH